MNEIKSIPPLKFKPIFKKKPWGGEKISQIKEFSVSEVDIGESWEISGVKGCETVVETGFLKGFTITQLLDRFKEKIVGKKLYKAYGNDFPLLIKFIDANGDLSIQVHPDDELAQKRGYPFGKTEMWYVLQSEKDACLFSGFNRSMTRDLVKKCLQDGTIMNVLRRWPTSSGDLYYIPGGTIHAIGKGNFVIEVQQTSDVTYRLFDYNRLGLDGRPRQLHIKEGIDAINYTTKLDSKIQYESILNENTKIVACPYFVTSLCQLNKPKLLSLKDIDSFVILIVTEGAFSIIDNTGNETELNTGHTLLLPAMTKEIIINPQTKPSSFLEVYCP